MKTPIFQVDAFTQKPFSGNPAGVCLLAEEKSAEWMQSVAKEMNLSETAFLLPERDGYRLRWFTPVMEVNLCGHATLASAHVLFEKEHVGEHRDIHFYTRSGELSARQEGEWIILNFPAYEEMPYDVPQELLIALEVKPINAVKSGENVLVEVQSEEEVRNLNPDFAALAKVPLFGIAVTSQSKTPEFDFVSRYFAPWAGIDEDPVTGSAHACLGPYWGKRLNKTKMLAHQTSQRGGIVRVELAGERVLLGGQAVLVLEGELLV
jgi:PhzF family phenazine biosynthesis protein